MGGGLRRGAGEEREETTKGGRRAPAALGPAGAVEMAPVVRDAKTACPGVAAVLVVAQKSPALNRVTGKPCGITRLPSVPKLLI